MNSNSPNDFKSTIRQVRGQTHQAGRRSRQWIPTGEWSAPNRFTRLVRRRRANARRLRLLGAQLEVLAGDLSEPAMGLASDQRDGWPRRSTSWSRPGAGRLTTRAGSVNNWLDIVANECHSSLSTCIWTIERPPQVARFRFRAMDHWLVRRSQMFLFASLFPGCFIPICSRP